MTMLELDRHTSILLERLVIAIEEQNCLQQEMNERLSMIQNILDNYNLWGEYYGKWRIKIY